MALSVVFRGKKTCSYNTALTCLRIAEFESLDNGMTATDNGSAIEDFDLVEKGFQDVSSREECFLRTHTLTADRIGPATAKLQRHTRPLEGHSRSGGCTA
jgi:hypothetical protein